MAKKTQAVKKSPAKKSSVKSPAKKSSKKDTAQELLAKELRTLIPKLDSEGLAFLIKQAKVHIYNMQVDELNKATVAAAAAAQKSKAGKAGKTPKKAVFDIDATGSGYYLRYQNSGTMFSKNEMTTLVKIVYGQGTEAEISERLFNWLERERLDIFSLVPIANKFDPLLKSLAALIQKNFKLVQK